jgi:hypothetical protein
MAMFRRPRIKRFMLTSFNKFSKPVSLISRNAFHHARHHAHHRRDKDGDMKKIDESPCRRKNDKSHDNADRNITRPGILTNVIVQPLAVNVGSHLLSQMK